MTPVGGSNAKEKSKIFENQGAMAMQLLHINYSTKIIDYFDRFAKK
jgi:hypothetical protein